MRLDELAKLTATETSRVEWKRSFRDGTGISQAVCALANDLGATKKPGYVLVGVQKDGEIVGVDTTSRTLDEIQQELASILHDIRLQPTPSTSITAVETDDAHTVIAIAVTPYDVPPVVTFSGVAWVRVGTTSRRATEADLGRLRERRPESRRPFDLRRVAGAGLDDLDLAMLKTRYELGRDEDHDLESFPSFASWLTNRDLGQGDEHVFVPNATGLLLFGKSPQTAFPGAVVELVRYSGSDVDADVAFRRTVTGTLPDQLDTLWSIAKANIVAVPTGRSGIREGFADVFPFPALEELFRNLIQHRAYDVTHAPSRVEWFDDRIELSNPGGPFGHASEGEFGMQSDYRNPTLTRWLSELGYVQNLGRGVRRVRLQLEKNGNPPLEVETDGYTRVTIRRRAE